MSEVPLQAADSGLRWRAGEELGPLDGVPIAVKDVADIVGYTTGHGTRFLADVKGVASSVSPETPNPKPQTPTPKAGLDMPAHFCSFSLCGGALPQASRPDISLVDVRCPRGFNRAMKAKPESRTRYAWRGCARRARSSSESAPCRREPPNPMSLKYALRPKPYEP